MKSNFRFIAIFVAMLCLVSFSIVAFAEETTTQEETTQTITTTESDFEAEEFDTEPFEETSEAEETEEAEETTSNRPTPTTEKENTKKPTKRPQNDVEVNNNRDEEDEEDDEEEDENDSTSVAGETELHIPEGMFVIYFEMNDGSPRKISTPASEPELISEPSEPKREGFIFDGWYKDPEFTEKWNFYTDMADEGTVLYAKWVPDPSSIVFKITVKPSAGGKVEVNPSIASPGEPVKINVTADEGMRISKNGVKINGEATNVLSFTMPSCDVVISVSFEAIPENEVEEEKTTIVPYIVAAVIVLVVLTVIIVVVRSRRDDFGEDEIDENGTVIDDDTDKSWVDESIVIEDGFKDGEKVKGNFIPETEENIFEDNE